MYDPWVDQEHALFRIQNNTKFLMFVKTQPKFSKVHFEVIEYIKII
jgi:hypothetical protein